MATFYPPHVEAINEAFAQSKADIEAAREIVESYEDALTRGDAALRIGGRAVIVSITSKPWPSCSAQASGDCFTVRNSTGAHPETGDGHVTELAADALTLDADYYQRLADLNVVALWHGSRTPSILCRSNAPVYGSSKT